MHPSHKLDRFELRLSSADKDTLFHQANTLGLSASEYVRLLIGTQSCTVHPLHSNYLTLGELHSTLFHIEAELQHLRSHPQPSQYLPLLNQLQTAIATLQQTLHHLRSQ